MPAFWYSEAPDGRSLVRDVFIETGCQTGTSLRLAADMGFRRLYSCDVEPGWVAICRKRFRWEARIAVLEGSSPQILPAVIDPARPTTFWLDAHYTAETHLIPGTQTPARELDEQVGQCPVLAELESIFARRWDAPPLVLIDDAQMYGDWRPADYPGFRREEWPALAAIKEALPAGYRLSVDRGIVWCLPRSS
jgi:hypothetical protein